MRLSSLILWHCCLAFKVGAKSAEATKSPETARKLSEYLSLGSSTVTFSWAYSGDEADFEYLCDEGGKSKKGKDGKVTSKAIECLKEAQSDSLKGISLKSKIKVLKKETKCSTMRGDDTVTVSIVIKSEAKLKGSKSAPGTTEQDVIDSLIEGYGFEAISPLGQCLYAAEGGPPGGTLAGVAVNYGDHQDDPSVIFDPPAGGGTCIAPLNVYQWQQLGRLQGFAFGWHPAEEGNCGQIPDFVTPDIDWVDSPREFSSADELVAYCKEDRQRLIAGGQDNEQMYCIHCGDDFETVYAGTYGEMSWPRTDRNTYETKSGLRMGSFDCTGTLQSLRMFHMVEDDNPIKNVQDELMKALNERNCDNIIDLFDPSALVKSNFGTYSGHKGVMEWCKSMVFTAATSRYTYWEPDSELYAFIFQLYAEPDIYIQNAAVLNLNHAGAITELKHLSTETELPHAPTECLCCSDDASEGMKWSADLKDFDMEPYNFGYRKYWIGLSTFGMDPTQLVSGFDETNPIDKCYISSILPINGCCGCELVPEGGVDDIDGPRWLAAFGDFWGQDGIFNYVSYLPNVAVVVQGPMAIQGFACSGCGDDNEDWAVTHFHSTALIPSTGVYASQKAYHFSNLGPNGKLQQTHTMATEATGAPFPTGYWGARAIKDSMIHALNSRDCKAFRDLYTDDATAIFSGGRYFGDDIEKYCKTQLFPTTGGWYFNSHAYEPFYFSFSMQQYNPVTMEPLESVMRIYTTDDGSKLTWSMQFHTVGLTDVEPQECSCCEGKSGKASKSKGKK